MHKKPLPTISITTEDQELFRNAMRNVRPLRKKHLGRVLPVKNNKIIKVRKIVVNTPEPVALEDDGFAPCDPNALIFFARSGLQQKTVRQLRQGKLPIERVLDLHARTIREAKAELQKFLALCEQRSTRTVLIIHGKGTAALKSAIFAWLKNYEDTLALSSAIARDGGAGATYLLLRK